jgi:hypothetical protein
MNDTAQTHTVFLDKEQLHLAHTMIRVGRNGIPPSTVLRSLEGKVLACRMSRYNGISYALQLTADEMQAMRSIDVEYCALMSQRVQELDDNPYRQTVPDAIRQMLRQYQYITKMMAVFSSL